MRAIIRYTGVELSIYSLDQEGPGGDEAWAFLNSKDPFDASCAKALAQLLKHIANSGLGNLSKKIRDCWNQDGVRFCELKKPPWRFSYFTFGRKVLMTTVFRKDRDKAVDEYRRAIRLCSAFKTNQRWEG